MELKKWIKGERNHLKIRLWIEVLQGKRTRGKETATETQKPSLNTARMIISFSKERTRKWNTPDNINEKRLREGSQNVASKLNIAKGNVAKEADGDVDAAAQVDGPLHHVVHLRWSGVWQGRVHGKDVCLAGEGERENGEALKHACGSPQVHF